MSSAGLLFDSFDPRLESDPYAYYDRLRAQEPVYWEPMLAAWVLSRYEDVRSVMEDDESFEVASVAAALRNLEHKSGDDYSELIRVMAAVTFFQSGEEHRIGRRSMSRAFTRIPIRELAPVIQGFAEELAEPLAAKAAFDAAAEYAIPVPLRVMAHILGVPAQEATRLYEIGNDMTLGFDVVSSTTYKRLNRTAITILDVVERLVREAVDSGTDHPLAYFHEESVLEGEARMREAAARAFFALLVGMVTTSSLIAFAIEMLLSQPGLYDRARQDTALVGPFVEEMLRLESPVQRVLRTAREACVIGGKEIRRGQRLLLLVGAANRDPSVFTEPGQPDLVRNDAAHIAFGAGPHVCVGAAIARLEANIAIERFLQLPAMVRGEGSRALHPTRTVRRLINLPVRCAGTGGRI